MTKKNPSVCHFAYKSLETTLVVSTFICTSCESFCVVHCAFLFNGFLFLCVFFVLTLNQKWGLVNMAVSVAVYVSACVCTLAYMWWPRKACCCLFIGVFVHFVSVLWGIWSWPVCVCIVCLLLERTVTHLSVSKTNQPNNTTDRILVNRLYLNKWTFLPETCFLVFSFFYIVNFLHWQSILELKSWVWSYYLFDSLD